MALRSCCSSLNMDVARRKFSIVVMVLSIWTLAQQHTSVDAAHWGDFGRGACVAPGVRHRYARLWDIAGDWTTACWQEPATIDSVYYGQPDNCVDKNLLGMWGEWQVRDSSCDPSWGQFHDRGCQSNGCRKFSAILWGIPSPINWEFWCLQSSADINGQHFDRPTRCIDTMFNMWGEFDVADSSCGECKP